MLPRFLETRANPPAGQPVQQKQREISFKGEQEAAGVFPTGALFEKDPFSAPSVSDEGIVVAANGGLLYKPFSGEPRLVPIPGVAEFRPAAILPANLVGALTESNEFLVASRQGCRILARRIVRSTARTAIVSLPEADSVALIETDCTLLNRIENLLDIEDARPFDRETVTILRLPGRRRASPRRVEPGATVCRSRLSRPVDIESQE